MIAGHLNTIQWLPSVKSIHADVPLMAVYFSWHTWPMFRGWPTTPGETIISFPGVFHSHGQAVKSGGPDAEAEV
jgi:hypothetical protein